MDEKQKRHIALMEEKEAFSFWEPKHGCDSLPKRVTNASFLSWVASTQDQLTAINAVVGWMISEARREKRGGNALLFGPPGTGKTHLAAAVANFFGMVGRKAVYSTAADMIRRVREAYDDRALTERAVFSEFTDADLLVMDEVGVGKDTDFSRETLHTIISRRYDKSLPTLFATNSSVKDFRAAIMDRAWDRIQEDGVISIRMVWDSWRTFPRTGPSLWTPPYGKPVAKTPMPSP